MMQNVKPQNYVPDLSIYPGLTLEEVLESRGISQADLARRMNRPLQAINEIVMGKKEITSGTAIALEHVLGLPANFWLNLEANYRESIARHKEAQALDRQIGMIGAYPYNEMANNGFVKHTNNRREKVQELLKWLGIASLELAPTQYEVAFRTSAKHKISKEKLISWLRHADVELQSRELDDFRKEDSEELLNGLRKMTLLDISKAQKEAQDLCARYGIALIFTPEFKAFPVSGASRWVSGKPVVQVSLRFKSHDHLWFSIFHELGHIYLHSRSLFIENAGHSVEQKKEEDEANKFAADHLISSDKYEEYLESGDCQTAKGIKEFAQKIGIAPGIVVGRLQREHRLKWNQFIGLKIPLKWALKN